LGGWNNYFTDEGLRVVNNFTDLTYLVLEGRRNNFTDEGLRILRGLKNLRSFDLKGNLITEVEIFRWEEAMR
jgi:hypothetical protein